MINNFNGESSVFNISFTGNSNFTKIISIYYKANVTSAVFNVSGFMGTTNQSLCFQESANVSTTCGGLNSGVYANGSVYPGESSSPVQYIYDENYSTSARADVYINYSKPSYATNNVLWQIKSTNNFENYSINTSNCWNTYSDKISLRLQTASIALTDAYRFQCFNGASWINLIPNGYYYDSEVYEEAIIWNVSSNILSNLNLTLNNTEIWSYSGNFTGTNNKTNDFYTKLNTALGDGNCTCSGCNLVLNVCSINFTFHSDSSGILQLSDIIINSTEFLKPNLTINSPNSTYNGATFIPVWINATDNYKLDSCYYNVTRGASLEIVTTKLINCNDTQITVSGDATYTFTVCINDTSNNINCSSTTFKTTNYVPYTGTGGGGGDSTSNIAFDWTMTTDGGTTNYNIQMTSSSNRVKQLLLENKGTTVKSITLRCENINGTLCTNVNFERSFSLQVLKGIKVSKPIEIIIPANYDNGEYSFNIYASDGAGNQQVVTFKITIGTFGSLTNFFIKAGSSMDINGIKVPYLLLGIGIGIIFWLLSYAVLHKKSYGGSVSFLIGIIATIIAIIIL